MSFITFQFRRNTAASWTSDNPTLAIGEFGLETDTLAVKLGDGTTAWTSLAYYSTKIRAGAGAPSGSTGVNGDLYYDTTNTKLYGPKIAGSWGSGTSLVGPTGAAATIAVHSTTTLAPGSSATVVNVGSSGAASLDFGIPAGATGAPGTNGTNGVINTLNTAAPLAGGGSASTLNLSIAAASASVPGYMTAAHYIEVAGQLASGIIFAVSNAYSNVKCDGATDDTAACTALFANAPDGSTIYFPGNNATMVLTSQVPIPSGKHFQLVGGGTGGKFHVLQTSPTNDHFVCNDWYTSFTGFDFVTNNTTTSTNGQALTSGTVLNVATINTALITSAGTINVGSSAGWQTLTYSARTSSTVTLSSTGTGTTVAGAPMVFKTAGAAINAGNLVGIDVIDNTFTCCFNGYVCSGSTSNQSTIATNGFLNTINFDILIDGANWNGIIDSNTMDCTTASRSLSHIELTQVGSCTGQGNQVIRGQYDLRIGSNTAAYPAGVFGVYFTNCFFDNAGIDAVKIQGISAVQRIKLTSCWLSSAQTGKGLNFASTASTLPSDIELVGCNIYSNSTDGVGGAGVADYSILGGQIAGNANGINIAPATGGVYSARIANVRIGPTGGIGANTTGVNIAAGTYTEIKINNCDTRGNTTPLTIGGTVTVTNFDRYAITDNPGINPRGSVGTIAVPATTVSRTNDTGFRCMVIFKSAGTAPTNITVNGVSTVLPAINTQITFVLDPGGTIVYTGTAPTWTWVGM